MKKIRNVTMALSVIMASIFSVIFLTIGYMLFLIGFSDLTTNVSANVLKILILIADLPWQLLAIIAASTVFLQLYMVTVVVSSTQRMKEEVERQAKLSSQFEEDSEALHDIRAEILRLEGLINDNLNDISRAMQISLEHIGALAPYAEKIKIVENYVANADLLVDGFVRGDSNWDAVELAIKKATTESDKLISQINHIVSFETPEDAFDKINMPTSTEKEKIDTIQSYSTKSRIFRYSIGRSRKKALISENRELGFAGEGKLPRAKN